MCHLPHALGRIEETGGTLNVAMRHAASRGPKRGEGGVRTNKPLIEDALALEGRREEFTQMSVSRVAQDKRTLDGVPRCVWRSGIRSTP